MSPTVNAEISRLLTVAKASGAAHAAVIRAMGVLDRLPAAYAGRDELRHLLHIASAALGSVPGQLNWYVPADSDDTLRDALRLYGLSPEVGPA